MWRLCDFQPAGQASTFGAPFGALKASMKELKQFWKQYSPYFLDIWQYVVILLVVIIAAIVIL